MNKIEKSILCMEYKNIIRSLTTINAVYKTNSPHISELENYKFLLEEAMKLEVSQ